MRTDHANIKYKYNLYNISDIYREKGKKMDHFTYTYMYIYIYINIYQSIMDTEHVKRKGALCQNIYCFR